MSATICLMSDDTIVVDFRNLPNGDSPEGGLERSLLGSVLPDVVDNAEAEYTQRSLQRDEIDSIKATFQRTSGNLAQTAREHDITPARVKKLALHYQWKLYGEPKESHEKSSTSNLERLRDELEAKMYELLGSLEIETKEWEESLKDGRASQYVASLSQRNTAFKDVFDRYMRVCALLEPETYGEDRGGSNTVARMVRGQADPNALGGVEGINRQISALFAGIVVTQDRVQVPPEHDTEDDGVIDVEAVDDRDSDE